MTINNDARSVDSDDDLLTLEELREQEADLIKQGDKAKELKLVRQKISAAEMIRDLYNEADTDDEDNDPQAEGKLRGFFGSLRKASSRVLNSSTKTVTSWATSMHTIQKSASTDDLDALAEEKS